VTEISSNEVNAIMATSDVAGEYMDKLDKTDLATLSRDEWFGFIEVVVMGYADAMAKLHKPFAVLRSKDDPISADEIPY